jgi:serine/threonine protein kinase
MSLTSGSRLGVYEVAAKIGEGGMGQVFRARDTKLNRDVALKVLPESFASDGDRLARFTREAQTLTSLPEEDAHAGRRVGNRHDRRCRSGGRESEQQWHSSGCNDFRSVCSFGGRRSRQTNRRRRIAIREWRSCLGIFLAGVPAGQRAFPGPSRVGRARDRAV